MSVRKIVKFCIVRCGLMSYYGYWLVLKKCNILKTLYYNFKLLPLKQAVKMPLAIGYNTIITNRGTIDLNSIEIEPLSIMVGIISIPAFEHHVIPTKIYNDGCLLFNNKTNIHPGVCLWIAKGAELAFDGFNIVGAGTKIACHNNIFMGKYSGCSWNCQIFDTDFHYIKDLVSGRIFDKDKSIFIGEDVFIGNHVNIGKGTKLPDGSVVSSWSNVTGSFMKKESAPFIASPKAEMLDSGFYIAHGYKMELDNKYGDIFKRSIKTKGKNDKHNKLDEEVQSNKNSGGGNFQNQTNYNLLAA